MSEMKKDYVLEIENLTVEYKVDGEITQAVTDVSLAVEAGKTLGLVGETGAGKTTTALAALRLVPDPPGIIKSGTIKVCGHDMMAAKDKELEKIRGAEISMIFQDPMTSLNPVFTVGDQIAESIMLHEKISRQDAWDKAMEMLELVGIPRTRGSEYPHQFSGGMKQRVMLAQALLGDPKVLILDEPTAGLDPRERARLRDHIHRLAQDRIVLLATHIVSDIEAIAKDILLLKQGQLLRSGTAGELIDSLPSDWIPVLHAPSLEDVYLYYLGEDDHE